MCSVSVLNALKNLKLVGSYCNTWEEFTTTVRRIWRRWQVTVSCSLTKSIWIYWSLKKTLKFPRRTFTVRSVVNNLHSKTNSSYISMLNIEARNLLVANPARNSSIRWLLWRTTCAVVNSQQSKSPLISWRRSMWLWRTRLSKLLLLTLSPAQLSQLWRWTWSR